MEPPCRRVDKQRQGVAIGRFEFREPAIFEQLAGQRMNRGEFLQGVGVGRKSTLGFFESLGRELEVVEKHLAQLNR